jgi:hypothetical protein
MFWKYHDHANVHTHEFPKLRIRKESTIADEKDCLKPLTWTKWCSTSTLFFSLVTLRILPISIFVWSNMSDANVDWGSSKTERTQPELNRRSRNTNNGTVTLSTYWWCLKISTMVLQSRSSSRLLHCWVFKYENSDELEYFTCGQTFSKSQRTRYNLKWFIKAKVL